MNKEYYYRVEGIFRGEYDTCVKAKSKKDAIEKAQDEIMDWFDEVDVERITKKEYEEYYE